MPLDITGREFNTDAEGKDFHRAHELMLGSGNARLISAFIGLEGVLLEHGNPKQQNDIGIATLSMFKGDTAAFDLIQKRAKTKDEYTPEINKSLADFRTVLEDDCADRKVKLHSSLASGPQFKIQSDF